MVSDAQIHCDSTFQAALGHLFSPHPTKFAQAKRALARRGDSFADATTNRLGFKLMTPQRDMSAVDHQYDRNKLLTSCHVKPGVKLN